MRRRSVIVTVAATVVVSAGAALALPGTVTAQDVTRLLRDAAPDATVRIMYDARPDVCGAGDDIRIRGSDGTARHVRGGDVAVTTHAQRESQPQCEHGPVLLELRRQDARITRAVVRIGRDDGMALPEYARVRPADAATFLLDAAVLRAAVPDAARQMVYAAVLADTPTWPQLLDLARDGDLERQPRTAAIFWLGQAAGDRAVVGLTGIAATTDEDLSVRESAVFALSRITDESATDALMQIALQHREPRIRRAALFWLANSATPRAVDFLEQILRNPP